MKKRATQHSPRKPRVLRQDELTIWHKVVETVSPLQPRKLPRLEDHIDRPADSPAASASGPALSGSMSTAAAAVAAKPLPEPLRPRIAGLNRLDTQKLSRGNVDIDGRIDLHGMSVARARSALLNFIESSRDLDRRNILVITGKGASPFTRHTLHSVDVYHASERQGVLRAELSHWLHEREFARHVVGFQPAHPRHGGGGAFYIRLRRKDARR
jgi:DNA-nicking Smr family endonuclease